MVLRAPGPGDPDLRAFLAEVNKAQRSIDAAILEARALPDTEPSKLVRIQRYNALKKDVDRTVAKLTRQAGVWSRSSIPRYYSQGFVSAAGMLDTSFEFTLIHKEAVDVLTRDAYDDVAGNLQQISTKFRDRLRAQQAFEELGTTKKAVIRTSARSTISKQLLTGLGDIDDLARELRDELWSEGISIVDGAGRNWNMETYTRMLSRTKTAQAYNSGSLGKYAEEGVSRVRVFDGEDDDAECAQANGQIWSIRFAYENVIQHPNCRRAFAPIVGAAPIDKATDEELRGIGGLLAVGSLATPVEELLLLEFLGKQIAGWKANKQVADLHDEWLVKLTSKLEMKILGTSYVDERVELLEEAINRWLQPLSEKLELDQPIRVNHPPAFKEARLRAVQEAENLLDVYKARRVELQKLAPPKPEPAKPELEFWDPAEMDAFADELNEALQRPGDPIVLAGVNHFAPTYVINMLEWLLKQDKATIDQAAALFNSPKRGFDSLLDYLQSPEQLRFGETVSRDPRDYLEAVYLSLRKIMDEKLPNGNVIDFIEELDSSLGPDDLWRIIDPKRKIDPVTSVLTDPPWVDLQGLPLPEELLLSSQFNLFRWDLEEFNDVLRQDRFVWVNSLENIHNAIPEVMTQLFGSNRVVKLLAPAGAMGDQAVVDGKWVVKAYKSLRFGPDPADIGLHVANSVVSESLHSPLHRGLGVPFFEQRFVQIHGKVLGITPFAPDVAVASFTRRFMRKPEVIGDIRKIHLGEYLSGELDRHDGNYLIREINGETRLQSIDHQFSFYMDDLGGIFVPPPLNSIGDGVPGNLNHGLLRDHSLTPSFLAPLTVEDLKNAGFNFPLETPKAVPVIIGTPGGNTLDHLGRQTYKLRIFTGGPLTRDLKAYIGSGLFETHDYNPITVFYLTEAESEVVDLMRTLDNPTNPYRVEALNRFRDLGTEVFDELDWVDWPGGSGDSLADLEDLMDIIAARTRTQIDRLLNEGLLVRPDVGEEWADLAGLRVRLGEQLTITDVDGFTTTGYVSHMYRDAAGDRRFNLLITRETDPSLITEGSGLGGTSRYYFGLGEDLLDRGGDAPIDAAAFFNSRPGMGDVNAILVSPKTYGDSTSFRIPVYDEFGVLRGFDSGDIQVDISGVTFSTREDVVEAARRTFTEMEAVAPEFRPTKVRFIDGLVESKDGKKAFGAYNEATREMVISLGAFETQLENVTSIVQHELGHAVRSRATEAVRAQLSLKVMADILDDPVLDARHKTWSELQEAVEDLIQTRKPEMSPVANLVEERVEIVVSRLARLQEEQAVEEMQRKVLSGKAPDWMAHPYAKSLESPVEGFHELIADAWTQSRVLGSTRVPPKGMPEREFFNLFYDERLLSILRGSSDLPRAHTRWTLTAIDRAAPELLLPVEKAFAASFLVDHIFKEGGFTVDVLTGKHQTKGWSVARYGWEETIDPKVMSREEVGKALDAYKERNIEILTDGDHYLGAWLDEDDTGLIYLDVVQLHPDELTAVSVGYQNLQKAIWNLGEGRGVSMGDFGSFSNYVYETRPWVLERLRQLGINPLQNNKDFNKVIINPVDPAKPAPMAMQSLPEELQIRILEDAKVRFSTIDKQKNVTDLVVTPELIVNNYRKVLEVAEAWFEANPIERAKARFYEDWLFRIIKVAEEAGWSSSVKRKTLGITDEVAHRVWNDLAEADQLMAQYGVYIPMDFLRSDSTAIQFTVANAAHIRKVAGAHTNAYTRGRKITIATTWTDVPGSLARNRTETILHEIGHALLGDGTLPKGFKPPSAYSKQPGEFWAEAFLATVTGRASDEISALVRERLTEIGALPSVPIVYPSRVTMESIVAGASAASAGMEASINIEFALSSARWLNRDPVISKRVAKQIQEIIDDYAAASKRDTHDWDVKVIPGKPLSVQPPEVVVQYVRLRLKDEKNMSIASKWGWGHMHRGMAAMMGLISVNDALGDSKVRSFLNNIFDPKDFLKYFHITIDYHMGNAGLWVLGMDASNIKWETPSTMGIAIGMRAMFASAARQLWDEGWGPRVGAESLAELQEVIWYIWKLGNEAGNKWWGDLPRVIRRP